MNEVFGVCVVLKPPGPNSVRVYSVISPLASRGRCQTTAMEDEDRFLVDTSKGTELGTKEKHVRARAHTRTHTRTHAHTHTHTHTRIQAKTQF